MTHERTAIVTSSDGTKLSVRVSGPEGAPALLLLHGVSSSSMTYDWLPEDVIAGVEIFNLDFRGHGKSAHAPGTYAHLNYVEDAICVLEKLIKRPALVSGFSLGGMVAWTIAQKRPELVKAVLLEEPVLFPEDVYVGIIPEILRHTIDQEIDWERRSVDEETATRELGQNPAGPDRTLSDIVHPDSVRALAISTRARDRGVTEAAIDGTMVLDIDVTSPLHVPAVVMAGGEQFGSIFHNKHGDILRRTHPQVEQIRVDQAGHDLHNSFAGREVYANTLKQFIARHAA